MQAETARKLAEADARKHGEATKAAEQQKLAAERAADTRARAKADADARAKADAEARARADAEAKAKAKADAEAQARAKAEEPKTTPAEDPFQSARALEREGKGKEAVKSYMAAVKTGNCDAAKRLGDIYGNGLVGIPRDSAESLKWYATARGLGCKIAGPSQRF